MRIFLLSLLLSMPAYAADHFLYQFKGHERVGDVLHKYEIGPLWGPRGHVQKTIKMNPDLMDKNGELYNSEVWVKLPIPNKAGWKLPQEIKGRLKHIGHVAVMDNKGFEDSEGEKEFKKQTRPKVKTVYKDISEFQAVESLIWGQDPFRKPAGIKTLTEDQASKMKGIQLEYIEFDPDYPSAVLDGRTVYEGSVTKEGSVIKIGLDYVILKNGTEVKQLVMDENKKE